VPLKITTDHAYTLYLKKCRRGGITNYHLMAYSFKKNDTDVAHYNFNAHQPILVIFGRDIAETQCICFLRGTVIIFIAENMWCTS